MFEITDTQSKCKSPPSMPDTRQIFLCRAGKILIMYRWILLRDVFQKSEWDWRDLGFPFCSSACYYSSTKVYSLLGTWDRILVIYLRLLWILYSADLSIFTLLQLLFISGLACVIGPWRTLNFFFQRHKMKASVSFLGGVFVVLMGWPIIGMILETYGFVLLFRWVFYGLSLDNGCFGN